MIGAGSRLAPAREGRRAAPADGSDQHRDAATAASTARSERPRNAVRRRRRRGCRTGWSPSGRATDRVPAIGARTGIRAGERLRIRRTRGLASCRRSRRATGRRRAANRRCGSPGARAAGADRRLPREAGQSASPGASRSSPEVTGADTCRSCGRGRAASVTAGWVGRDRLGVGSGAARAAGPEPASRPAARRRRAPARPATPWLGGAGAASGSGAVAAGARTAASGRGGRRRWRDRGRRHRLGRGRGRFGGRGGQEAQRIEVAVRIGADADAEEDIGLGMRGDSGRADRPDHGALGDLGVRGGRRSSRGGRA